MPKNSKFLLDQPEIVDSFGPHTRLAKLLKEDICSGDRGHSIGLLGDWGSGKSTVISILEKNLAECSEDVTVFKYDAWAHQGDPLRRSFLDDLITFLSAGESAPLNPDSSKALLARIWDKTETTETKIEPQFRPHVPWLVLALLLVPVGGALELMVKVIGSADSQYVYFPFGVHIIAYGLLLAPFIAYLIFFLFHKFSAVEHCKKLFGEDYDRTSFKVTAVFVEKITGKRESKTIRNAQDSVIEFRLAFEDVLRAAAEGRPNWRFVIVIDNIDRLPVMQARQFWGTMTTFFDSVSFGAGPRDKKYWLLVPFSAEILSRIFREPETSGRPDEVSKGFIEKTFDMVLRVPPPVIANWRKYIFELLRDAFPDHDEHILLEVRDVYDLIGVGVNRSISPRILKLFVNDVVALYRQREDEIDLPLLAAYALRGDKIEHDGLNIITGEVLTEPQQRVLSADDRQDWRNYFAALHFGVPVDDGLHFLMQGQIQTALIQGKPELLTPLEETPGFVHVLVKAASSVLSDWSTNDLSYLSNIATCLGPLQAASTADLKAVWKGLRKALGRVQRWDASTESPDKAFKIILANTPPAQQIVVAKSIAAILPSALVEEPHLSPVTHSCVSNWLKAARTIESFTDRTGAIEIPAGPLFGLAVLQRMAKGSADGLQSQHYKFLTSDAALAAGLAAEIGSGRTISEPFPFVNFLKSQHKEFDWTSVSAQCVARITTAAPSEPECRNLVLMLLGIAYVMNFKGTQVELTNLSLNGHLFHWLQVCKEDSVATAAILVSTILANPEGTKTADFTSNSPLGQTLYQSLTKGPEFNPDLIKEVAAIVTDVNRKGWLYQIGAKWPNLRDFVTRATSLVLIQGNTLSIKPDFILKNQDYIQTVNDVVPAEQVLNEFIVDRPALLAELVNQGFNLDSLRLYCWLSPKDASTGNLGFLDFLKKGVDAVTHEQWKSIILTPGEKSGQVISLFDVLAGSDADFHLGLNVQSALKEYIRSIRQGTVPYSEGSSTRVTELYERLSHSSRDLLTQEILEDLRATSEPTPILNVISAASSLLSSSAFVRSDKSVRVQRIFLPILDAPSQSGLTWVARILLEQPHLLQEIDEEVASGFAERHDAALKKDWPPEVRLLLDKISQYIVIETPPTSQ